MRGQEDRPQGVILDQRSYGRGDGGAIPSHHEELAHSTADLLAHGIAYGQGEGQLTDLDPARRDLAHRMLPWLPHCSSLDCTSAGFSQGCSVQRCAARSLVTLCAWPYW